MHSVALEDVVSEYQTRYRTVGQSVVAILREAILNGAFEPGERLIQEDLAERIGVSRIPVRTALMQLEVEGLVVFEPHHGATVRSVGRERVREIYTLRILLETHALRAAALTLTSESKAELVREAAALDESHEGPDFLQRRIEFYRKLYDVENHPATLEIIEQLRVSIGRHRLGIRMDNQGFSHQELARAVKRGQLDRAEALLQRHLSYVCERQVASLPE